jgi:toxin YoeB
LATILNKVENDSEVCFVKRKAGKELVIIDADDYRGMEETLYLFSTKANTMHLLESMAQVKRGEGVKIGNIRDYIHPLIFRKYRILAKKNSKSTLAEIYQLVDSIEQAPEYGIGKPEHFKGAGGNHWSRRINREHKMVYQIEGNSIYMLQCRFQYDP